MPEITKMGALRVAKPEEWVRLVTRAVRKHHGFLTDAAVELHVGRRTLQRWLTNDDRLSEARKLVSPSGVHRPKADAS